MYRKGREVSEVIRTEKKKLWKKKENERLEGEANEVKGEEDKKDKGKDGSRD